MNLILQKICRITTILIVPLTLRYLQLLHHIMILFGVRSLDNSNNGKLDNVKSVKTSKSNVILKHIEYYGTVVMDMAKRYPNIISANNSSLMSYQEFIIPKNNNINYMTLNVIENVSNTKFILGKKKKKKKKRSLTKSTSYYNG